MEPSTVTLRDIGSNACEVQELVEGRLDWEAVKEAFGATTVKIVGRGIPPLHRAGEKTGLTWNRFKEGQQVDVTVEHAEPKNLETKLMEELDKKLEKQKNEMVDAVRAKLRGAGKRMPSNAVEAH